MNKKQAILHAVYYLTLKGVKRTLRCVQLNGDNVSLMDEETDYTFDMKKDYFLFRLRTASWHEPTLPTLNETAPFFTFEDLEEFRRADVAQGERLPVPFAEDLSSEDFEQSISFLLSANCAERDEIKRRTSYDSGDLYCELQYFFDFPKSRTESKKRELLNAHNVAFNVMLESRGSSWLTNHG